MTHYKHTHILVIFVQLGIYLCTYHILTSCHKSTVNNEVLSWHTWKCLRNKAPLHTKKGITPVETDGYGFFLLLKNWTSCISSLSSVGLASFELATRILKGENVEQFLYVTPANITWHLETFLENMFSELFYPAVIGYQILIAKINSIGWKNSLT